MRLMVILALWYLAVFVVFSATGGSERFLKAYARWIKHPLWGILLLYVGQIVFWPVFVLEYVRRTENPLPLIIFCVLFMIVWIV